MNSWSWWTWHEGMERMDGCREVRHFLINAKGHWTWWTSWDLHSGLCSRRESPDAWTAFSPTIWHLHLSDTTCRSAHWKRLPIVSSGDTGLPAYSYEQRNTCFPSWRCFQPDSQERGDIRKWVIAYCLIVLGDWASTCIRTTVFRTNIWHVLACIDREYSLKVCWLKLADCNSWWSGQFWSGHDIQVTSHITCMLEPNSYERGINSGV